MKLNMTQFFPNFAFGTNYKVRDTKPLKKRNNQWGCFVLAISFITLSGCSTIKEVIIGNASKVELKGMYNNVVTFDLTLPIENPNNFRVKVKVKDLKVMLANNEIGKVKQMDKFVIARKSKKEYTVRIAVELTDAKSGLNSAFGFFSGQQPDIRLTGKVKASTLFYRRTFELNNYKLVR